MDSETPAIRTLRRALATVGGDHSELAQRLEVPPERLAKWLAGEEPPSVEAYSMALDIFASGPLWSIPASDESSEENPPNV